MSISVSVEFRLKSYNLLARFTKKVWYSAIRKSVLISKFGVPGIKMNRPTEVFTKSGRYTIEFYAPLKIRIGSFTFKDNFLVSDDLVNIVDKTADLIVGSKFIEKYRIRVLENKE